MMTSLMYVEFSYYGHCFLTLVIVPKGDRVRGRFHLALQGHVPAIGRAYQLVGHCDDRVNWGGTETVREWGM